MTHQTQPSPIQILDSSIQTLITSFHRRQTWLRLLLLIPNLSQDQNFTPNWRTHLANFLESTWVHVFSIILLVVDLLITVLELSSSLISCNEPNPQDRTTTTQREETDIGVVFHWVGIAILGLLCLKSVALMVGMGFSSFWRHGGCVVDAVVVAAALVLEGWLEEKGGGLVVVVSLWRVVRVVEGVFEISDEAIEAQIEGIVCQFEAVREENRILLEVIGKLKQDLDQCC